MSARLEGKVTIVTGAGSGIGKATAIRFAEEGARVTCVDIDGESAAATAHEIGSAAFAVTADISDPGRSAPTPTTPSRAGAGCTWRSTMPGSTFRACFTRRPTKS